MQQLNAIQQLAAMAKETGHPATLRHNDSARTIEVFLPNGETLLCASVVTLPRNRTLFVTPDAIRNPGMVFEIKTDIAHCWFVWLPESGLHGQFHSETDAVQFCQA